MNRRDNVSRFGPTIGDRVRLGDTDLWIRVEHDEPVWGYAKNIRSRMTQFDRAGDSELDVLIAGVLLVDPIRPTRCRSWGTR